jgi:Tol biopolymer transport system component/predicted Ser/Thr protein kinase
MAVSIGDNVGPYEVCGLIGAGGMGEVYRAKDTRLGRSVALKVLPAALANDKDYMARFEREAQVLASLNHPNIAAIYGLEEKAIVMELVEGRTLAECDALPLEDALQYARQIAEALEAAHEKGIIHRDLKPANVKVTPDGTVKVLDFGLAKSMEVGVAASISQDSPTLTVRATQAGVILGTVSYMSPEQAAGKPADRRSDIWSFGVVLYEMLAGRRLFQGETVSHTLADVLRGEIDLTKLRPETPSAIRDLIARCLDRKLKTRLQWIGEARIAIEDFLAHPTQPAPGISIHVRSPLPWIAATCVLGIAAAACGVLAWRANRPVEKPLVRFTDDLGRDVVLVDLMAGPSPRNGPNVVISPDGSRIVFISKGKDGRTRLFTRRFDQQNATLLEGTEGAVAPFFSPDSAWVGFLVSGKLKKTPVNGGTPFDVCTASVPLGATWGDDGNIIIAPLSGGLLRVPATGGTPQPITKLEAGETSHRWPTLLPGAKSVIYSAGIGGNFSAGKIVAQRLDTGERKVLHFFASFPRYLASGHLVFVSSGTLHAVPFDRERLAMLGTPTQILRDLKYAPDSGAAQLDFSRTGTMIYRSGNAVQRMVSWVDQDGKFKPALPSTGMFGNPILSPDGKRLAVWILESGQSNIWIFDTGRQEGYRLTFEPGATIPRWTPDGRHIVYTSPTGLYWTRADGGGKPVRLLERGSPEWFTRDGKRLAYALAGTPGRPCRVVTIEGDPEQPRAGTPEPCFESDAEWQRSSELSPDGRWIAYASLETAEIYVRRFPDRGGKWQITSGGGGAPRWSADGRTLFYIDEDEGRLMAVPVQPGTDSFVAGRPRPWTSKSVGTGVFVNFSPSPDGKRVVVLVDAASEVRDTHVNVALNFFDEIRRQLRPAEMK